MDVSQLLKKDGTTKIQPIAPDKVGHIGTASETSLATNTTVSAPDDGWIYVLYGAGNNSTLFGVNVLINDRMMVQWKNNGGKYLQGDSIIPVKKGDSIKSEKSLSSYTFPSSFEIWFRPNRTNLENGGGEFDTLICGFEGVLA